MRITRIERQKRRPGRVSLYADGQFLAGISEETLVRLALRKGDQLGTEQINALKKAEELLSARNTALRLLAVRPRTVREIRTRLREKEFAESEITTVVSELQASGLLNDAEFARMYVRQATALRPVGPARLRQKLLLLGIDRQCIEESIREAGKSTSGEELAERVARQYLKRQRASVDPRLRKRLSDLLSRRGFDWDTVRSVTSRLLNKPDNE